jgi:protein-S-isoprenylcysteine O-methyltransferase Ste14
MRPVTLQTARLLFVYVPLVACAIVVLIKRPSSRHLGAAFLALLWTMPALLLIEMLAHHLGWWRMNAPAGLFPIAGDVWIGWALAWGALPALALWRRPVTAVVFAWWVDLVLMPYALNLVDLGHEWLVGEFAALTFAMLPGLLLARWTIEGRLLKARVVMQMLIFSAWTLWLIPMAALRRYPPQEEPLWPLLVLLAPFGAVAASAVHEFARRGGGTPYPYDPPQRLVTSGAYAYVANPMQASMTIVLLGLGQVFRSPAIALGALVATAYGSGLAAWHEKVTVPDRFGDRWTAYRAAVRSWLPRWRPYVESESTIYVAFSCGVCTSVGTWISKRGPVRLVIAPAESLDDPPRRIMYVPADGGPADHGIGAFGRALEHMNLVWRWSA